MPRLSTIPAEKIEELTTTVRAKAFLGREFLMWLWFETEKSEGEWSVSSLNIDHDYSLRIWIDDRVVLESMSSQSHSHTIKGGDPAHSAEAHVALKHGKTVREMKLGLEIDGAGPYLVTLSSDGISASGLTPRSLNLPKNQDEEDVTQPLATRLQQIQTFTDVFDAIFRKFLDQRLASTWESKTLPDIRTWIKNQPLEQSLAIH